ncbi:transcription elongation factor GreA [Paraburkholderia unamae]|uniref:transcription elongation factor GreA n=1 Tax=Paraburkholderia unamae TaxID=219649 RepID=UPI001FCC8F3E|nr:transcription elongation factor GreA [Paraburkholderia unamae]
MPRSIGLVVSKKYATPHELQTVYGAEDLYDLLEIIVVDGHNDRIMSERKE